MGGGSERAGEARAAVEKLAECGGGNMQPEVGLEPQGRKRKVSLVSLLGERERGAREGRRDAKRQKNGEQGREKTACLGQWSP